MRPVGSEGGEKASVVGVGLLLLVLGTVGAGATLLLRTDLIDPQEITNLSYKIEGKPSSTDAFG